MKVSRSRIDVNYASNQSNHLNHRKSLLNQATKNHEKSVKKDFEWVENTHYS